MQKTAGVRLIIGYKLVKAVAQVVLAAFVFYGAAHGLRASLADFAHELQHHATNALTNKISAALARLFSVRGSLWRIGGALAGDGVFSAFEGWALHRGYRWAPWVVVIATASLIPFEVVAIVHHRRAGRFVLLAINLAIVAYLAWRARREHIERQLQANSRPWRGSALSGSA